MHTFQNHILWFSVCLLQKNSHFALLFSADWAVCSLLLADICTLHRHRHRHTCIGITFFVATVYGIIRSMSYLSLPFISRNGSNVYRTLYYMFVSYSFTHTRRFHTWFFENRKKMKMHFSSNLTHFGDTTKQACYIDDGLRWARWWFDIVHTESM